MAYCKPQCLCALSGCSDNYLFENMVQPSPFLSAPDMSLFSLFIYDLLCYSYIFFNSLGYPLEEKSQGIGTTSGGVRPSYVKQQRT